MHGHESPTMRRTTHTPPGTWSCKKCTKQEDDEFTAQWTPTERETLDQLDQTSLYSGSDGLAKVGGNPNSATSQWFINYKDNSANLDAQNGGFTVFGEVIEGMDNLDNIALLPICSEIPMPEYTSTECADADFVPGVDNFVTIHTVTIIDDSTTTDASLASDKNTSLNNEE